MRKFTDRDGRLWTATARGEDGADYKGRFHLAFHSEEDSEADELALTDVRWNSARTATRTLETMSVVELRRRLDSARRRHRSSTIA